MRKRLEKHEFMKNDKLPTYCNGTRLAAILTKKFGRLVIPSAITRAVRDEGMIGKQPNGSWRVSDAVKWWETHRASQGEDFARLMAEANIAEMRKKISDAKKSRLEADRVEREVSGKWIQFDTVKSYMAGLGSRVANQYDGLIESKDGLRLLVQEVMAANGIAPETARAIDAQIAERFATANDEIKAQFRKLADDATAQFAAARRQQLKNQL